MNARMPIPEDPRLFYINELGARMTVADTKDVRLHLWGELRGKIDEYLRDATATACVGKRAQ